MVNNRRANTVINDRKNVLNRFKRVELIIAGTTRKIIKGLVTPPV